MKRVLLLCPLFLVILSGCWTMKLPECKKCSEEVLAPTRILPKLPSGSVLKDWFMFSFGTDLAPSETTIKSSVLEMSGTTDVFNQVSGAMGTVTITSLKDKDLNVCGDGKARCRSAAIVASVVGNGFESVLFDNDKVPVMVSVFSHGEVLEPGKYTILSQIDIDQERAELTIADFARTKFTVSGQFGKAGAYRGSVVFQYVLLK
jgi:hypothetical protein